MEIYNKVSKILTIHQLLYHAIITIATRTKIKAIKKADFT